MSRILRYGSTCAEADATASDKIAIDSSAGGVSENSQENHNQGFELRQGNQQTAELASTPTAHLPHSNHSISTRSLTPIRGLRYKRRVAQ